MRILFAVLAVASVILFCAPDVTGATPRTLERPTTR